MLGMFSSYRRLYQCEGLSCHAHESQRTMSKKNMIEVTCYEPISALVSKVVSKGVLRRSLHVELDGFICRE
jgi:hypothetical protein